MEQSFTATILLSSLFLIAALWHSVLEQIHQCQLALLVLSLSPSSLFSLSLFGFVFLFSFPPSVLIYLPLTFSDDAVLSHLCECSVSSKGHCRISYMSFPRNYTLYVQDTWYSWRNLLNSHWMYCSVHSQCRHVEISFVLMSLMLAFRHVCLVYKKHVWNEWMKWCEILGMSALKMWRQNLTLNFVLTFTACAG